MTAAGAFLVYNLGGALLAGALTWTVVAAGAWLLGIRDGKLRLCLFTAPVIKSTLVLLGMSGVVLWPVGPFAAWRDLALSPDTLLPWFVLASGLLIAWRAAAASHARRSILRDARPASEVDPELEIALDRVLKRARAANRLLPAACESTPPRPAVLVSARVSSPTALIGAQPVLVFPPGWSQAMSGTALDGAVAHELAHLQVRRPFGCLSSELVRSFTALNPFAIVMSRQLELEEEKACDDFAVRVLGDPEAYAAMLVDGYRFARARAHRWTPLRFAAQLVGRRPAISQRVERILEPDAHDTVPQFVSFALLWFVLSLLFFSG